MVSAPSYYTLPYDNHHAAAAAAASAATALRSAYNACFLVSAQAAAYVRR